MSTSPSSSSSSSSSSDSSDSSSSSSRYIHKSHNVSLLLYHLVCPTKYRRAVITEEVDSVLRQVCLDIADRHEVTFLEIGTDRHHVHFLLQSVPTYSPTQIVRIIKSITAREVFRQIPLVKKALWGGAFWTSGYFINSVSRHGSEDTIRRYVKDQGNEPDYKQLYVQELSLFDP